MVLDNRPPQVQKATMDTISASVHAPARRGVNLRIRLRYRPHRLPYLKSRIDTWREMLCTPPKNSRYQCRLVVLPSLALDPLGDESGSTRWVTARVHRRTGSSLLLPPPGQLGASEILRCSMGSLRRPELPKRRGRIPAESLLRWYMPRIDAATAGACSVANVG